MPNMSKTSPHLSHSVPHMLEQHASQLSAAINWNTVIALADSESALGTLSSERWWPQFQKCHHYSCVFYLIWSHASKKKERKDTRYNSFLLIKILLRAQGALLPRPSFLSSVVKYVNKMSKVILQRGTKEKRGLREKTAIKFLRFSITLARGGPASSQSLAAGERARAIESHISNPTHTKNKISFQLQPSKGPPFHFISYRIISQLLISQRWSSAAFLRRTVVVAEMR